MQAAVLEKKAADQNQLMDSFPTFDAHQLHQKFVEIFDKVINIAHENSMELSKDPFNLADLREVMEVIYYGEKKAAKLNRNELVLFKLMSYLLTIKAYDLMQGFSMEFDLDNIKKADLNALFKTALATDKNPSILRPYLEMAEILFPHEFLLTTSKSRLLGLPSYNPNHNLAEDFPDTLHELVRALYPPNNPFFMTLIQKLTQLRDGDMSFALTDKEKEDLSIMFGEGLAAVDQMNSMDADGHGEEDLSTTHHTGDIVDYDAEITRIVKDCYRFILELTIQKRAKRQQELASAK